MTIELTVIPADQHKTRVPDVDNLLKLVMDGLKKAGALGELDDCALVEVSARKLRARQPLTWASVALASAPAWAASAPGPTVGP